MQLAWQVGRSDNLAHFRFTPGAHGGTVTAIDDAASELIDPDFNRPLRPVAPVAQLDFESRADPEPAPASGKPRQPKPSTGEHPARNRRGKPAIPAWEDVLLGCALQRRNADTVVRVRYLGSVSASANSVSHAPVTPTPAPSTNQRNTGCAPPTPQRRRQPPGRHDVEPDGQQRMHPDQSEAEHHNRDGGDRGDEPGHRQTRCPRRGSSVTSQPP